MKTPQWMVTQSFVFDDERERMEALERKAKQYMALRLQSGEPDKAEGGDEG